MRDKEGKKWSFTSSLVTVGLGPPMKEACVVTSWPSSRSAELGASSPAATARRPEEEN